MTLRIPSGLGVDVVGDTVYVAPLPDGPIAVLAGIAALIWSEADGRGRDEVVAALAEATGERVEAIGPTVQDFVDDLVARGLLAED